MLVNSYIKVEHLQYIPHSLPHASGLIVNNHHILHQNFANFFSELSTAQLEQHPLVQKLLTKFGCR
jgi:hypothetical protein